MKLMIDHIAAVAHAEIALDGITVICGKNDTGKSTISKSLWCLFNGLYRYEAQVESERRSSIVNVINGLLIGILPTSFGNVPISEILNDLFSNMERTAADKSFVYRQIKSIYDYIDPEAAESHTDSIESAVETIMQQAKVSNDRVFQHLLNSRFDDEFHGQINNIDANTIGHVQLVIRGKRSDVEFTDHRITAIRVSDSLRTRAMYIDDPFVLDKMCDPIPYWNMLIHQSQLADALGSSWEGWEVPGAPREPRKSDVMQSIVADEKLANVLSRLSAIVAGSISGKNRNVVYRRSGKDEPLDVRNISAGMKSFVILKTLLQNGTLEQHGTVILDEPEVHLHPEWQLAYAEIVVLLQKEFDLHILLNTHSPYFLHAVEVFAARHEVADRCKYYLMKHGENASRAIDVSDKVEMIYQEMANPFATLDELVPED